MNTFLVLSVEIWRKLYLNSQPVRLERKQSSVGTGAGNSQLVKSLNYSKLLYVFSLNVFT